MLRRTPISNSFRRLDGTAAWFVVGVDERGRLVVVPRRGSLIVLGEPGTGKSSALVQVNALPWHGGPTLVRSTRADNRRRVISALTSTGRPCFLLDLDAVGTIGTGCEPYRVSLLSRASSWSAAREVALRLVRAARESGVQLDGADKVFEEYAAEVFAALLLAASLGRRNGLDWSLGDVARWFADVRSSECFDAAVQQPRDALVAWGDADDRHALGGLATIGTDRMNRGDTIQKVSEAVGHLLTGESLRQLVAADRSGGTDPASVLSSGAVVFIEVSDHHAARSRAHAALASLVEDDMVAAMRQIWPTGALSQPLRLLYDESATGSVNPNVATWAATGAGDGVALMVCAQSLDQLERVFPREGAGLVNVFNHRLFLRGHALDGERVAAMFGQRPEIRIQRGGSRSSFGLPGRTWGEVHERVPRVTADLLVTIPDWYGLLASSGHLGRVRLLPSFRDPWAAWFPA